MLRKDGWCGFDERRRSEKRDVIDKKMTDGRRVKSAGKRGR